MKCERCREVEAVPISLTIPKPPDSINPRAPREVVGEMLYCRPCLVAAYGAEFAAKFMPARDVCAGCAQDQAAAVSDKIEDGGTYRLPAFPGADEDGI